MFMNFNAPIPKVKLGMILTALVVWILPLPGAEAKIDQNKIYYGDAQNFTSPAVVDAMEVYKEIPAHQEIMRRNLTREDPDYWPLMRKASQLFVRALRKACQSKGYDLVGEVDSITIEGEKVPEITAEVIKILKEPKTSSFGFTP